MDPARLSVVDPVAAHLRIGPGVDRHAGAISARDVAMLEDEPTLCDIDPIPHAFAAELLERQVRDPADIRLEQHHVRIGRTHHDLVAGAPPKDFEWLIDDDAAVVEAWIDDDPITWRSCFDRFDQRRVTSATPLIEYPGWWFGPIDRMPRGRGVDGRACRTLVAVVLGDGRFCRPSLALLHRRR